MIVLTPTGGDDTSLINSALANNRYVYLNGAVFNISAPLILSLTGNTLYGNGKNATSIIANRPANDTFTMLLNYKAVYGGISNGDITLRDFSLHANGQSLTTLTIDSVTKFAWGIYISTTHHTTIRNVNVYDTGLRAIGLQSCHQALVEDCKVENVGYIPYVNQTDLRWDVKADGNGISLNSCIDSKVKNCIANNCRDLNITLWQSINSSIENCTGDGNMVTVASTNIRGAFSIESSAESCIIQDCIANNNTGSTVQISSIHSIVRRVTINNYTGWAVATARGVHNSHFEDITVNGAASGSNGFLIGQSDDTEYNHRLTVQRCILNSISASIGYGIQTQRIVSGFIEDCIINMLDGSQTGIGVFWDGSTTSLTLDSNIINGKSNYGYELNNVVGVIAKNSTINGTKNAGFSLSRAHSTLIDSNIVQNDTINNQNPNMTVRMDAATSSSNATISNNTFKDYTGNYTLGINDQNGASNPTLINNHE